MYTCQSQSQLPTQPWTHPYSQARAMLFSRILCDGGCALYLHCPIWSLLAPVTIEHLACGWWDWGSELLIKSNLDSLKVGSSFSGKDEKEWRFVRLWIFKQVLQELALGETVARVKFVVSMLSALLLLPFHIYIYHVRSYFLSFPQRRLAQTCFALPLLGASTMCVTTCPHTKLG